MVVGRLLPVVGPKRLITVGAGLTAAGLLLLVVMHDDASQIAIASAVMGAGIGSAYASLANQVVDWVLKSHTSVFVGMNTIARFSGSAFAGQVSAAILASSVTVLGSPSEHGFEVAFAVAGVGALAGAVAACFGPSRGRAQSSSSR
jgi:MFS family permease